MRVTVAITVAVLLTCAVAPELEAGRTGGQGKQRGAGATKLGRLRNAPQAIRGTLGRARAATRKRAGRVAARVRRTAGRQADRVARGGVFAGLGIIWLGATHVAPEHQMKAVVGGIVIAAASASITWFRLIRGLRRQEQAYRDRFQAEFDEFERVFAQATAGAGDGRARSDSGYRAPPRAAPPIPRPPPGETWPADLVAALEEMAGTTDKDQLGKVYRRAAKRYHPDIGGDEEHAKTLNSFHTALENAMP